ncbi:MAG TPA: potassium/proton antiporter [Vicinamibacterales bacterium]|nr:potassium/proton antiporter [Vicinamibacterales bacterium]
MFFIDRLILLGGALLVVGIASSKVSARIGLPVLVLFLAVGMLAGEDGFGGIDFDNFAAAHAIGTVALAAILFDGGLQTRTSALRAAWKPAALLATVGVLLTAAITGTAAWFVLDVPLLTGLLLGSIVASTDAAAVFSVLRSQGVQLRERLAATLEIESGSNDPMAIFLTIGLVEVLASRMTLGWDLATLFVMQMGVGTLVGLGTGALAVHVINRINLGAAGLYPVLAGACGFVAYGLAATLGGSGFLSIYLAGIVVGNSRVVFQRGTFLFMDGLAWMGQIVMFVVLGLLSTPSDLVGVAGSGLLIAAVLIGVARPLAVVPLLWPFRFSWREEVLIAWVGLKGAVPIILATYPLLFGLADGRLLFNIVFFVVLVSAILQGWTLPLLASRLGLQEEKPPPPAVSLELLTLRDVNADIVDYTVPAGSPLAGRTVQDLQLPDGAVLAMISRGSSLIAPRGSTELRPGDHLFVVARAETRRALDRALASSP